MFHISNKVICKYNDYLNLVQKIEYDCVLLFLLNLFYACLFNPIFINNLITE